MNGVEATRLPAQLTSFIGRQKEIATVRDLLASTRLLTLSGAGGSGKTRLALEVAARVESDFEHGLAFVELARVTDATRVPDAIATALGVAEQPGRTTVDALSEALRARSLLLILDNCEHVVDACAALADRLLRSCPHLHILATSREALGIGGEMAWLVPPLSVPAVSAPDAAAAVEEAEAVQLFVQRASEVRPGFALTDANAAAVAQICRRLDGIPLAIELAAVRLRALGPDAIARRLDDRFALLTGGSRTALPRHQTLRAAIDWSYELLEARQRHLLDRLSIFSGGFSLEAAETVCAGEEIEGAAVLDLLSGLVERSLVELVEHGGDARYRLLETVRQYAAERLAGRGEDDLLRGRHARFFAALVETAEPHFTTPNRPVWIAVVERDFDNIRQALRWAAQHDAGLRLRLAGMLCWYWFSTERWSEGRRWLESALAHEVAAAPSRDRAAALFAGGVIACLQGDSAAARPWLEEAISIADALGDGRLGAYARNYLGMNLAFEDRPEGEAVTHEAATWFREHDDLYGLRLAYLLLGAYRQRAGRLEEALHITERGVEAARAFGLDRELAIALQSFGVLVLAAGDTERAATLFREALAALDRDPNPIFLSRGLYLYGIVQSGRGAPLEAARFFGAAEALRESIAAGVFAVDRALLEAAIATGRTAVGDAAFDRAREEGRRLPVRALVDSAVAGVGAIADSGEGWSAERVTETRATDPAATAGPESTGAASTTAAQSQFAVEDRPDGPGSHAGPGGRRPAGRQAAGRQPALRVRALGTLEIELDGAALDADAWSHSRPRDILLLLLWHPDGRTRDQIGAALWPEASTAQVKNNFHVALHHLRRTLGRADWVLQENGRYRLSPAYGVEFDATAFEDQAHSALRDTRTGLDTAERLDAALALYRGDFLQDERVGDWHLEHRDRLRRLYADALSARGGQLMATEAYVEAAELYRRLVRLEDLDEDAHRRLMTCLSRLGERGRALRHYDTLAALLRHELDAEPEAETTELYHRLQRADVV